MSSIMDRIDAAYGQGRDYAEQFMRSERDRLENLGDNYLSDYASVCNELGTLYRGSSQFVGAICHYQYSLQALERLCGTPCTLEYAVVLINLATTYRLMGLSNKSFETFKHARDLMDRLEEGDTYARASLDNNEALAFQDAGNYEAALRLATEGFRIMHQLRPSQVEDAISMSNLASLALRANDLATAQAYAQKALRLYEQVGVTTGHYASVVGVNAAVCFQRGEYDQALEGFQKAAELIKKNVGENLEYAAALSNMGAVYRALGDEDKAQSLRDEAEKIRKDKL